MKAEILDFNKRIFAVVSECTGCGSSVTIFIDGKSTGTIQGHTMTTDGRFHRTWSNCDEIVTVMFGDRDFTSIIKDSSFHIDIKNINIVYEESLEVQLEG